MKENLSSCYHKNIWIRSIKGWEKMHLDGHAIKAYEDRLDKKRTKLKMSHKYFLPLKTPFFLHTHVHKQKCLGFLYRRENVKTIIFVFIFKPIMD